MSSDHPARAPVPTVQRRCSVGQARFSVRTDGLDTATSEDQLDCESACAGFLTPFSRLPARTRDVLTQHGVFDAEGHVMLMHGVHVEYLEQGLQSLSSSMSSLDASRTWLCYWIVHSLNLLGSPPLLFRSRIIDFLRRCQNSSGGFGGGPQQLPHLAPSYSACFALLSLGSHEAYDAIDRRAMYRFLLSMKQPAGGFAVHESGECDVRATYTALAVASGLNLLTPELIAGTADHLLGCQTFEGGFGGEAGNEAHGGYAFCAVAALVILKQVHRADLRALERWLVLRQMPFEGGFQGRTNKLVDGCYSYWQGALFVVLAGLARGPTGPMARWWYPEGADAFSRLSPLPLLDEVALQQYVLLCCQVVQGGLRDKPDKRPDYYHTCYCLSGLSCAQHLGCAYSGPRRNVVAELDPVWNLESDMAMRAEAYFRALPCTHEALL